MNISYEVTNDGGAIIYIVTGTELREHFGVEPTSPIFTEQLVHKFNLTNECAGKPERMRQVISID
jgi:hypothetical protein